MFNPNCFAYGFSQPIADYVAGPTLTAARWVALGCFAAAYAYRKAHTIATHPRTIQAAKLTVWALYLAAVVAYALGQTARIGYRYLVARINLEVDTALCPENPAPAIPPAPTVEAAPIETAPQAQAISATAAPAAAKATTAQAKPAQARSRRVKPSVAPKGRASGGRGRKAAIA